MSQISFFFTILTVYAFSVVNAEEYLYLSGRQLGGDSQPTRLQARSYDTSTNTYGPSIPMFPEDALLSICDSRRDLCLTFNYNRQPDSNFPDLKVFQTDSNWDSYLSTTLCDKGVTATNVSSPKGNQYKYCNGYDNANILKAKYQLPPALCQSTCDQDDECIGYAVDTVGQNCYTYKGAAYSNIESWVYLDQSALVTSPYPTIQKIKAMGQNMTETKM